MANRRDMADCPFGCPRSDSSVASYNDYVIECKVCGVKGPNSSRYVPRYRDVAGAYMKNAATLLWNARTPQQMERAKLQCADPQEIRRKDLFGGAPAPAPVSGAWLACLRSHGPFIKDVEYRVNTAGADKDQVWALDDEDVQHHVPAEVFLHAVAVA